ncbi:MAG TPA: hypothetical protein VIJ19_11585, partial [Opitutaceae bacterium]
PERFKWGSPTIPTTSVPYFDARCGLRFTDSPDFERALPRFLESMDRSAHRPRDYILENLTVEKCSQKFVDLLRENLA